MDQVGIFIFGALACWFSQDRRHSVQRWACIMGLLAQPFWYYSAITNAQWGIVAVCIPYTAAWLRGLVNYWLMPFDGHPRERTAAGKTHDINVTVNGDSMACSLCGRTAAGKMC